jgi:dethiobiotin synthetase
MFIVIDTFDNPYIHTDREGKVVTFSTYEDALAQADDHQEAIVVPLEGIGELVELLTEASAMIDVTRFEEGEEFDEDNLEGRINSCLSKFKA